MKLLVIRTLVLKFLLAWVHLWNVKARICDELDGIKVREEHTKLVYFLL